MNNKDLFLGFVAALLISIFLIPTFINTGVMENLPFPYALLFVGLPVLTVIGLFIAYTLGKKLLLIWQAAKFGLVGVLNTAIDFGILNFFIALTNVSSGPGIILMNATSFSVALVNSFFWNKEWVFGSSKKNSFGVFLVVTLMGLAINTGIVYGVTTFVSPIFVDSQALWANLAKVLATGFSMVWNFVGYKVIVFRR